MTLTSLSFILFLLITLTIYYLFPKNYQWIVLLISSIVFYYFSCGYAVLYMISTTLVVYGCAILIHKNNENFEKHKINYEKEKRKELKKELRSKNKIIVTIGVLLVLCLLSLFKYNIFLIDSINSLLKPFGLEVLESSLKLIAPLGISYYSLMLIGYIVDVYRGTIVAEKNPFKVLLFTCYFPHIVEGPFNTYGKLSTQFNEKHTFNYDNLINAIYLFMLGLVKKMVIADRFAFIANAVFNNFENYYGIPILIGMLAYATQLYFDFSGCIDIVRGASSMFGIEMPINFQRPFFSKSVQEFWRRWHITLGEWLRNYIFYPVSLSKFSKKITKLIKGNSYYSNIAPTIIPLLCVWVVMGIWHGASWKYVIYGLYFFFVIFIGLLLEPLFIKFYNLLKIKRDSKPIQMLQILRTNLIVLVGLTLFRVKTFVQFKLMMKSLLHIEATAYEGIYSILSIANIGFKEFWRIFTCSCSEGVIAIKSACTDLYLWDYRIAFFFVLVFLIADYLKEKGIDIHEKIINNNNLRWILITLFCLLTILFGVYGTGYTEQPFVYAEF